MESEPRYRSVTNSIAQGRASEMSPGGIAIVRVRRPSATASVALVPAVSHDKAIFPIRGGRTAKGIVSVDDRSRVNAAPRFAEIAQLQHGSKTAGMIGEGKAHSICEQAPADGAPARRRRYAA